MFIPLWLIFFGSGLIMAVLIIVWGIGSGQFDDQQRARFLPLVGLTSEEMKVKPVKKRLADSLGMLSIMVLGVGAICAALLMTIRHGME